MTQERAWKLQSISRNEAIFPDQPTANLTGFNICQLNARADIVTIVRSKVGGSQRNPSSDSGPQISYLNLKFSKNQQADRARGANSKIGRRVENNQRIRWKRDLTILRCPLDESTTGWKRSEMDPTSEALCRLWIVPPEEAPKRREYEI
jgi:hypothetical protein